MKDAIKITQEKSTSWLIVLEAFFVSGIFGFYLYQQGVHSALAFTIAILGGALIRYLIIYVEQIFWVWSLSLSGGAGYLVYLWVSSSNGDKGWAIFWSVFIFLIVIGVHVTAREHSQIEDTPNEIKKITK